MVASFPFSPRFRRSLGRFLTPSLQRTGPAFFPVPDRKRWDDYSLFPFRAARSCSPPFSPLPFLFNRDGSGLSLFSVLVLKEREMVVFSSLLSFPLGAFSLFQHTHRLLPFLFFLQLRSPPFWSRVLFFSPSFHLLLLRTARR